MNRRLAAVVSAALLVLGLSLFKPFQERSASVPKAAAKLPVASEEPVPSEPPAAPEEPKQVAEQPALQAAPSASALPVPPSAALDEASLMAKLRELRGSNPALTLALSREARARFENSPDAAEQAWFVVKSLSDLGRHDEARVEGSALVKAYPGTRWAEDTYRHLFVNPPTDPAERGYGKVRELP